MNQYFFKNAEPAANLGFVIVCGGYDGAHTEPVGDEYKHMDD